jgi:LCP family protein required for cell wall assembly
MSTPPRNPRPPRTRSPFAAAFLSLIFPGLGHAYAGAYGRALAFAALPILALALLAGIVLRVDRFDLLGFVIQQEVLIALLGANLVVLVYRIVAAIDAWQVARFLNTMDASGGGRLGRARLPLSTLSIAGLIAVLLVMAGGHVAVARYNMLALDLVGCVFSEDDSANCTTAEESPSPGESPSASGSEEPSLAPSDSPEAGQSAVPGATGTIAPTLPPWDGKQKLNILLVGVDQRGNQGYFNTDTLIVVSVDPKTQQVAMFQIPRDTTSVPVPANARSVWGSVYANKINAWYANNRVRPDLWPGKNVTTRGFNSLKAILGELYGIDIPYYVMVNFQGFRDAVNTLGGVQINVQIPVAESDYPVGGGKVTRIYIPAGPQHMTGAEALIYARSRHRAQGGDFDRGRRQQRVITSLKAQTNPRAVLANLDQLVKDMKGAVKTDIPISLMPKLLSLADSVDLKNIRSYVFAPNYYASQGYNSSGTYVVEPNVARIRKAVKEAFSTSPELLDLRDRLSAEEARVWVLNGSGRSGLNTDAAEYLAYDGLDASAPKKSAPRQAKTTIVAYNGAETSMPATVSYLEDLYKVKVTTATDPTVPVDLVVTLGADAPALNVSPVN